MCHSTVTPSDVCIIHRALAASSAHVATVICAMSTPITRSLPPIRNNDDANDIIDDVFVTCV